MPGCCLGWPSDRKLSDKKSSVKRAETAPVAMSDFWTLTKGSGGLVWASAARVQHCGAV
jgi:hypothetical protein